MQTVNRCGGGGGGWASGKMYSTIVVELCWGMLAGRYCLVPRLERTENGQILQALRVSTIERPPHHVLEIDLRRCIERRPPCIRVADSP